MKGIKLILACLLFTTFTITRCTTWQYLVKYEDDLWILYEEISNNTIRTTVYAYGCKIILTYPARVEPYENFTVYINITDPAWAKYIKIGSSWHNGTLNLFNNSTDEIWSFLNFYWTKCQFNLIYDFEVKGYEEHNVTISIPIVASPEVGDIMILNVFIAKENPLKYILENKYPPFVSVEIFCSVVTTTPMVGANSVIDKFMKYDVLNGNYLRLRGEYLKLLVNYTHLKTLYESLNYNYTNLMVEYKELKQEYVELEEKYSNLQNDYYNVLQERERLKDEIMTLEGRVRTFLSLYNRVKVISYILLILVILLLVLLIMSSKGRDNVTVS